MAIIKQAGKMTSIIHTEYKLTVGEKLVKISEKKMLVNADRGGITIKSAKKIIANGNAETAVSLDNYQGSCKRLVENTEVTFVNSLDDGSANDGVVRNIQKGIVYGKEYSFEVESYTNGISKNLNTVKWKIKYHDLNQGWKEINSPAIKGNSTRITTNDPEMCGRFVYVKAYINNPGWISLDELKSPVTDAQREWQGELKLWHHNRFRWLDKKILIDGAKERTDNKRPWLIDQGDSSLCGLAITGFYFARDYPNDYKQFILDMHRKGESIIKTTKYKVTIDRDEHLLTYKQTDKEYPNDSNGKNKMNPADFIFLVTVKDFLNNVFDYDPDGPNSGGMMEGGTGLTLPNEVEMLFKKILNHKDAKNDTNLITSKWSGASSSAKKLKDLINNGYDIAILINSTNFTRNKDEIETFPTHWVGLLDITDNTIKEEISVYVYTWGGFKTWTVSYDVFKDGYFGYVTGK
jgi:hypothetical protein